MTTSRTYKTKIITISDMDRDNDMPAHAKYSLFRVSPTISKASISATVVIPARW